MNPTNNNDVPCFDKATSEHATLTLSRIEELLSRFSQLTIGLLGDLFLDRYLEIDPQLQEISIETGLPAYQVTSVRNAPGALGTVLNNLAALGVGRLVPVTVIGDDGHGYDLLRAMDNLPVVTDHIVRSRDRLTPTYTKPLEMGNCGIPRELSRLDVRSRTPLSASTQEMLEAHLRAAFPMCDGWIVLDQVPEADCGVVNSLTRLRLRELANQFRGKLVLIDSRMRLGLFDFGTLKGNQSEFLRAGGSATSTDQFSLQDTARVVRSLAQRTQRTAFCTLGEHGMLVMPPHGSAYRVAAVHVEGPIDIVGAGDAATSGLVAALLSGATALEAAAVGNIAASITVQQIGTTGVATAAQVRERLASAGAPEIAKLD